MKCVICKNGELHPGRTTVTLSKDDRAIIIKNVPALICDNCGESYTDDTVTGNLFDMADQAAAKGTEFEVRLYDAV